MHAPRMCAVFVIFARLQFVANQCTRCECENRNENASRSCNDGGTFEDGCGPKFSTLRQNTGDLGIEKIIRTLAKWAQSAWSSGITLKLNVLKTESKDTFVNVRLRNGNAAAADAEGDGRAFGLRKRMQLFLLLPISFKLGIIMTLLLVLTAVSVKTLFVGFAILLLLLNYTHGHAKLWGSSKVREVSDLQKNIHIHVHTLPENHYPYAQWHDSPSESVVYSA